MKLFGILVLFLVLVASEALNLGGLLGGSKKKSKASSSKASCTSIATDIAMNCFMKSMKKQKCDTSTISGMFSGVSGILGKRSFLSGLTKKNPLTGGINSNQVDALTGMCNACTGCKMSAKQCVLAKAVGVQEGQCALVDKLKGFVL